MWSRVREYLGMNGEQESGGLITDILYQNARKRSRVFRFFIIGYELLMMLSISMRPGGPFLKPRRTAYFVLYLLLIAVTLLSFWQENRMQKKGSGSQRLLQAQSVYLILFNLWGVAITLNDQLGGNGLTIFEYVILLSAIMATVKPWKMMLLFAADFALLEFFLPFFPDPSGLDNSFSYLMNGLFLITVASVIQTAFYRSALLAAQNEVLQRGQYERMEADNRTLNAEAFRDSLTGMQNRNCFQRAVREFDGSCSCMACIYIDVNGLHEINNRLGHEAGDAMLHTVANFLMQYFRARESFRIGGDEFVVLCKNFPYEKLQQRMAHVRRMVGKAEYSISVGIEWRDRDIVLSDMLIEAERKMLCDKEQHYANDGAGRQKRVLDNRAEKLLSEKKETEAFLATVIAEYSGAYYVDLETGSLQKLIPFPELETYLDASAQQFGQAVQELIRQEAIPEDAARLCGSPESTELPAFWQKGESKLQFVFRRADGTQLRIRVLPVQAFGDKTAKTLWIFLEETCQGMPAGIRGH